MLDIDDFAELLYQLFDSHFGVIHDDRDAHYIWQFAAPNGKGLQFGATTTQHTDDAVKGAMPVIGEHNECM